jgi:hypothetical protein
MPLQITNAEIGGEEKRRSLADLKPDLQIPFHRLSLLCGQEKSLFRVFYAPEASRGWFLQRGNLIFREGPGGRGWE